LLVFGFANSSYTKNETYFTNLNLNEIIVKF